MEEMKELAQKAFVLIKKHVLLVILVGLYLFLTLSSLLSSSHYLYNLEPYPDGLFYVVPALSFVRNDGFQMVLGTKQFLVNVPPLYSALLIPLYFFKPKPELFLVINVLLGSISLLAIYGAVWKILRNIWVASFSAVMLLAHGYFMWYAALPMSENLAISLVSVFVFFMAEQKLSKPVVIGLASTAAALVLTKLAFLPVAAALLGLTAYRLIILKQQRFVFLLAVVTLCWVGVAILYQFFVIRYNPATVFEAQYEAKSDQVLTAFSLSYMASNIQFYLKTFLGGMTQLLWMNLPLTSLSVVGVSLLSIVYCQKFSRASWVILTCWVVLGSQFTLLLPFYVTDARYVLLSLPMLSILLALTVFQVIQKKSTKQIWLILGGVCLVLANLAWSQKNLYRQIMAANILHRSQAWQWESIHHFESFFQDKQNAYLGTVLPPFLVDIYSSHHYQLLPLSLQQEFMNPSQRPWAETNYQDLTQTYQQLLLRGESVYISNAYLSSQHSFEKDWQQLQQRFRLVLVSEGCMQTCNIYQLSLLDSP